MTNILGQFSWLLHLLDIAVVAVLIYHFLLLLKSAGMALRLLLWLAVGFFVYIFARLVNLDALGLLLDNIFSVSLLVFVIVFQHDIRRALMHLSRDTNPPEADKEETGELINELAVAAETLALKRIGALVVVQRGMPLDNFLAEGTDIDAKLTSELITSIFLPYSPIHDGAVIIQGEKITKAGCFLPLTQNPKIAKSFGTRHRAAIGLSELVDALVIVISEETGRISLVFGGRILENLDITLLRKELKRQLIGRRTT